MERMSFIRNSAGVAAEIFTGNCEEKETKMKSRKKALARNRKRASSRKEPQFTGMKWGEGNSQISECDREGGCTCVPANFADRFGGSSTSEPQSFRTSETGKIPRCHRSDCKNK